MNSDSPSRQKSNIEGVSKSGLKLLSLWEPWATLMAIGAKRIETRSWSTSYRGWLAIQASKGGLSKRDLADTLMEQEFIDALGLATTPALVVPEFPRGCIVAVVRLIECCPTEAHICLPGVFDEYRELDTPRERAFGDYAAGRWGWVTGELFRLPEPIPFRAKQGLCDVDPATVELIRAQWRASMPICGANSKDETPEGLPGDGR